MDRRDFLKMTGLASVTALAFYLSPGILSGSRRPVRYSRPTSRYRIHGSKKLGCSGHDFPRDPAILETGQFMPHL